MSSYTIICHLKSSGHVRVEPKLCYDDNLHCRSCKYMYIPFLAYRTSCRSQEFKFKRCTLFLWLSPSTCESGNDTVASDDGLHFFV